MRQAIQEAYQFIRQKPIATLIATIIFLFVSPFGFLFGIGIMAYLSFLSPKAESDSFSQLQLRSLLAIFLLGLTLWALLRYPVSTSPLYGVPLTWLLIQPFWIALLLSFRYRLSLRIALKSVWHLTRLYSGITCQFALLSLPIFLPPYILGFLSNSMADAFTPFFCYFPITPFALFLVSICELLSEFAHVTQITTLFLHSLVGFSGFFILPLSFFSTLRRIEALHPECAAAIQRSY